MQCMFVCEYCSDACTRAVWVEKVSGMLIGREGMSLCGSFTE
jgi:hypothetical protein